MQDRVLSTRLFSPVGLELCANVIDIAGVQFVPDDTKAYLDFTIAHTWPAITAYGSAMHPGTVAKSYQSMQHQVFNKAHLMKSYDTSKEKDQIPRDHILGTIVAVELQNPQNTLNTQNLRMGDNVRIRAAAVVHKAAEGVPKILGEHMSGRHKWTVSMEVDYHVLDSGFVVMNRADASPAQEKLMAETSLEEFTGQGLGYVPVERAPEAMLELYDFDNMRMRPNARWGRLPVVLLKGGVNGQVHFRGVGLVRYGAEREAQIARILATDPDRLTEDGEGDAGLVALRSYFQAVVGNT